MVKLFDITKFDSYKEDNRREVKKANGGLPIALWDTYSSFANTYGGETILRVKELDEKKEQLADGSAHDPKPRARLKARTSGHKESADEGHPDRGDERRLSERNSDESLRGDGLPRG